MPFDFAQGERRMGWTNPKSSHSQSIACCLVQRRETGNDLNRLEERSGIKQASVLLDARQ